VLPRRQSTTRRVLAYFSDRPARAHQTDRSSASPFEQLLLEYQLQMFTSATGEPATLVAGGSRGPRGSSRFLRRLTSPARQSLRYDSCSRFSAISAACSPRAARRLQNPSL